MTQIITGGEPKWACYVMFPHRGWVVDTGVGGVFSFNIDKAKWWHSAEECSAELLACEMLVGDPPPVVHHWIVRVR